MLRIDCINVGYGDAILLRSDGARPRTVLVDCGDTRANVHPHSGARMTAADFLSARGIEELDVLWLTHLHLDHVGGLEELCGIKVRRLVTSYLPPKERIGTLAPIPKAADGGVVCLLTALNIYSTALEKLLSAGTRVTLLNPMEALYAPDEPNLRLTPYFAPSAEPFAFQQRCLDEALLGRPDIASLHRLDLLMNDLSIGLRAESGDAAAELPGDLGLTHCRALLTKPCEVFKMPHHGHRAAVDGTLMAMLSPKLTVISVSADRTDDCPEQGCIAAAAAHSASVRFTDAVTLNGHAERVESISVTLT